MNEDLQGQILHEYHSIPMHLLHRDMANDIREAVTNRPRQFERDLLASLCSLDGPVSLSWESLLSIADRLEQEIATTLSRRHVLFWQHLYRRIFPIVLDEDGDKVGQVTARLVRSICEAAIVKHGALSERSGLEDIATADIEKVLGGWLAKGVRELSRNAEDAERFLQHYQNEHQWVIVDFDAEDLVNLYYAEGLCFQYWKTTARLRSVGKGALLFVCRDGATVYEPDAQLSRLFASYDKRAASYSNAKSSGLGVWYEGEESGQQSILCLLPNAGRLDIGSIFAARGVDMHAPDGSQFISNFVPLFMDGDDFIKSHQYVAEAFKKVRRFSISSAVELLNALTVLALMHHSTNHAKQFGVEMARAYNLVSLCKRGYILMSASDGTKFLRLLVDHLTFRGFGRVEIDSLFSSFTLTDQTRTKVSLWSRGPQFVFFPYKELMLVDFNGVVELLANLFVGVRDDAHVRGMEFEENVRASLTSRGVKMEQRNFKFLDESKAEADAVFYRDGKLVVVDCFSMWRPLDFEISRPKTAAHRQLALDEKVRYALGRSSKLASQLAGRNFDFTKASEIVTLVVTPKVEWLWEDSELLWLEPGTPRVMQANEFVAWATDDN